MLTQLAIWLNSVANAIGRIALAPVAWLPGWLSATLIGLLTGVAMLYVFKHTSNQAAIKRTRDQIKANMLALSLFKDNLLVSLRCQGRLLRGAGTLLWYSLMPMAVLTIPMIMVLGQMAIWYQARPLEGGEESVVTVILSDEANDAVDDIHLFESADAQVVTGPVRVPRKNMVCWNVTPTTNGLHQLKFDVDGTEFSKELAVGGRYKPTSLKRPSQELEDVLIHPREAPFPPESIVQSIEVAYPERDSFTSGTNYWIVYWFVVSMVAAFVAKPFLNVNI